VHGGIEITLVDDVDDNFGALTHLERRARDGAVVGEHPNRLAFQLLGDGRDTELELVAVRELDELGRHDLSNAGGPGRKVLGWHHASAPSRT
jgi:hypothetical protein